MISDVVIANKTYARMNIADAAGVDEIALKVIRQDAPDFLLPMKMLEIDGELELRFEITEGSRLNYLPETMSKKEFLILLENMLLPLKECNDWFLNYCNFCLDKNYIMVSKNNEVVRYIYVPDENYTQTEESVMNFFQEFVLNINLNDDPVYIMSLYRHIKEKDATITTILEYIEKDLGKKKTLQDVEEISQKNIESPKPQMDLEVNRSAENNLAGNNGIAANWESTKAEGAKENLEFGQSDVQNDLINNLFGEVEEESKKKKKPEKKEKVKKEKQPKEVKASKQSKGLFGGILGGKNQKGDMGHPDVKPNVQPVIPNAAPVVQQFAESVTPLNEQTQEDVTVISSGEPVKSHGTTLTLKLEEDRGYHFPQYIEIDLQKGYATIGRFDKAGNPQADYNFDAALSFISRRHCRVERKGNSFVIIDLGSGNGTFLNHEQLVANMPYQIKVGDRIIFSKNHKITYLVC